MTTVESILAWHFVGDRLRDGSPIPAVGEWLEYDGPLVMCQSGLHVSEKLIDALRYAPGETVCRVECSGEVLHDTDKLVCSRRLILWRLDLEEVLRVFSRWCALQVVDAWNPPPVVIEWLETGSNRSAADSAARLAAYSAAYSAAREKQNEQLEKMVFELHNTMEKV